MPVQNPEQKGPGSNLKFGRIFGRDRLINSELLLSKTERPLFNASSVGFGAIVAIQHLNVEH